MPLSVFGYNPPSRIEDQIGTSSDYSHSFGGHPNDFDLTFTNAPRPLHLIYRLDLRDPLIPFNNSGGDFLPLLIAFNYDGNCCYEILSNNEIKLLYPVVKKGRKAQFFPPWDAPEVFPLQRTAFSPQTYDPTNADHVMDWKGVFGWDELSPAERERALELARQRTSWTREDGLDDDWTYEDVIRNMYDPPFAQSEPSRYCKNPSCSERGLRVIALQDRAVGAEQIWPDRLAQTIWQRCDKCDCVTTTNQCG